MSKNPDIYLLYEYMKKLPFTVRFKVQLDAPVDAAMLDQAAQEAIKRLGRRSKLHSDPQRQTGRRAAGKERKTGLGQ